MVPSKLSEDAESNGDFSLSEYKGRLREKETNELQQELAQHCFDLLFIETQIEASEADDIASGAAAAAGIARRISRLRLKIASLEQELFSRKQSQVSEK